MKLDPYLLALAGVVLLAALFPATGVWQARLEDIVYAAIATLFFLYGARLSPRQIRDGLLHWRLQALVFAATYGLFPLIGLSTAWLVRPWLDPWLTTGILVLCILPSTVQSSIAFTSIARGNVPAALSSASLSNIAGVVLTPVLASLVLTAGAHSLPTGAIRDIALQLLLPFAIGQAMRPLIGSWTPRWKTLTSLFDRGCILLVVYAAFSAGVVEGVWQRLDATNLAVILLVDVVILAVILVMTTQVSRALRFNKEDEIAIVFCGSKKSMATGIPMATVLLPTTGVALAVVPLMIFHPLQLFVCALLAKKYAERQSQKSEE